MNENEQLIGLLLAKNKTIATSESLTGGLLSASLTDIPGASHAFLYGNCTYTYPMKEKHYPGLLMQIEQDKTAVSAVVATRMARGVRLFANSDFALSTTGLAGPDGDGVREVGTVFIGFSSKANTFAREFHFTGKTRDVVRQTAVLEALSLALTEIQKELS